MMKFDENLFTKPFKLRHSDKIYMVNWKEQKIDDNFLFTFDKKTVFNATSKEDMSKLTKEQMELFIKENYDDYHELWWWRMNVQDE